MSLHASCTCVASHLNRQGSSADGVVNPALDGIREELEKKDLKIGDVVRISTTIDIRDIADPSSKVANK